jgi:drug/metabolite transporter (DMT)-like permease
MTTVLSFAAALAAAVAFGIASLLQQAGARRSPLRRTIGPRLLGELLRQPAFVLGGALDVAGFVLTFLALRHLPLFAVEATVSSSIAVTAVGCAWRGERLGRTGRRAVGAVVVGLVLVGAGALPEAAPSLSGLGRLALLCGVPALAAVGFAVGRRLDGPLAAPALGGLAGVAFALFGVAARVLPQSGFVADPLAWAAVAYVALGVLLYGAALQRGPVTAVAAATTAAETILPALAGLALADGARAGFGPVAALGFLITIGATLILVRSPGTVPGRPDSGPDLVIPDLPASSPRIGAPLLGR